MKSKLKVGMTLLVVNFLTFSFTAFAADVHGKYICTKGCRCKNLAEVKSIGSRKQMQTL